MQISIKLALAIGIILGCTTLGFATGHAIGSMLGKEITAIVEEQKEDVLHNPLTK